MNAFDDAFMAYKESFSPGVFAAVADLVAMEPAKTCTCCGKIFTKSTWAALPLMGVVEVDDGVYMEMKNCDACVSTLMWNERSGK